ncbi:MAG: hypothetical protein EKK49_17070 [Rhodocyclaceae bacterium]|nr:MAG: hypothetical protein EKK49_17070 [Rhodocyclaceae bacterium]
MTNGFLHVTRSSGRLTDFFRQAKNPFFNMKNWIFHAEESSSGTTAFLRHAAESTGCMKKSSGGVTKKLVARPPIIGGRRQSFLSCERRLFSAEKMIFSWGKITSSARPGLPAGGPTLRTSRRAPCG